MGRLNVRNFGLISDIFRPARKLIGNGVQTFGDFSSENQKTKALFVEEF
jgi:hypothetical protein